MREKEKKSIGKGDAGSERISESKSESSSLHFEVETIAKSVEVNEFIHNKFIITFDSLRCTTQSILIVFESYYNNRTEYPNFHQITTTTTNDEHRKGQEKKK